MAMSNFLITVMGVGAVVYLMKTDVRTGANMFRRNLRQIRSWLDEAGEAAGKAVKEEVKQVEQRVPPKPDKQP